MSQHPPLKDAALTGAFFANLPIENCIQTYNRFPAVVKPAVFLLSLTLDRHNRHCRPSSAMNGALL